MFIHKSNFDDKDRKFAIIKESAKKGKEHVKRLFTERMEKNDETLRTTMATLFDSSQCNSF
jgi:ferritin-like protein